MSGDELYLLHILDAIARVERYAAVGHAEFMAATHWQDTVIRQLFTPGYASARDCGPCGGSQ